MPIMWLKGADISAIRNASGMNQREFGELLGVADATVNRWEHNKRRPNYEMMEQLNKLADKYLKNGRKRELAKA